MSDTTNIPDDASFDPILAALPADVETIIGEYSGSGDSGEFDGISFLDAANQPVRFEGEDAVSHELERRFEDLLQERHAGWEINDGGGGVFKLHVKTRTLDHEHNDYYTESETTNHQSEV